MALLARGVRAALILVVVASVATAAGVEARPADAATGDCSPSAAWGTLNRTLAAQVVQLVNAHRQAMGLGALSVSTSLTASAEWKSLHMAGYGYMAHDDPAPPVARTVQQRLEACGYPSGSAGWGENIAYYYPDAASVVNAWLSDAGHKANIESPYWTTIGVGAARNASGLLYWTQDFGTVGASSTPPPPPPTTGTDTQPPSTPGALTVTGASGTTLAISWQASSDNVGVAGYELYLDSQLLGTTGAITGTVSGLACGTSHTVLVDAYDSAGNRSAGASATGTTSACSTSSTPPPTSSGGSTTAAAGSGSSAGSSSSGTSAASGGGASAGGSGGGSASGPGGGPVTPPSVGDGIVISSSTGATTSAATKAAVVKAARLETLKKQLATLKLTVKKLEQKLAAAKRTSVKHSLAKKIAALKVSEAKVTKQIQLLK